MKKLLSLVFCMALISTNTVHAEITQDGGTGTSEATVNQTAAVFSVTVPTQLLLQAKPDGESEVGNAVITNNSDGPVKVSNVEIEATGGWQLADYGSDFINMKVDTQEIGFMLNNGTTTNSGYTFDEANFPTMSAGGTLDLTYSSKIPPRQTALTEEQVANVVFTVDWVEAEKISGAPDESLLKNQFKLLDVIYTFNVGETWADWISTENNVDSKFSIKSDRVFFDGNTDYVVTNSLTGYAVKPTDKIQSKYVYEIMSLNPVEGDVFYVDSIKYKYDSSKTRWRDYVKTEDGAKHFEVYQGYVRLKSGSFIANNGTFLEDSDTISINGNYETKDTDLHITIDGNPVTIRRSTPESLDWELGTGLIPNAIFVSDGYIVKKDDSSVALSKDGDFMRVGLDVEDGASYTFEHIPERTIRVNGTETPYNVGDRYSALGNYDTNYNLFVTQYDQYGENGILCIDYNDDGYEDGSFESTPVDPNNFIQFYESVAFAPKKLSINASLECPEYGSQSYYDLQIPYGAVNYNLMGPYPWEHHHSNMDITTDIMGDEYAIHNSGGYGSVILTMIDKNATSGYLNIRCYDPNQPW